MRIEELAEKFNVVAGVSAQAPEHDERPWLGNLADAALQAGGRPAHLLLGEAHVNGSFLETYMMLAENPGLFEAAARNGVKHFVVEFPVKFQEPIDSYARGDIDRDGLFWRLFDDPAYHFVSPWVTDAAAGQFQAAFVFAIDNALAAGMTVHAVDVTSDKLNAMPPEIVALEEKLTARHAEEKSTLPVQQYIANYIMGLSDDEKRSIVETITSYRYAQRANRLDDTAQLDYLRGRFPAGEGMMGLFGLAHLDDTAHAGLGLNSQLEREGASVATVEIYNKRNTMDFLNANYDASGTVKGRKPDYTVILDEEAVLDKNLAPVDLGKARPAASRPPSL